MIQIKDVTKLYPAKAAAPTSPIGSEKVAASARRTERFHALDHISLHVTQASGFPSWDRRVRVNRRW